MDFKKVLHILIKAFTKNNINYAVIGGFAIGTMGVMRSTMDIDFLIDVKDIDKIKKIMQVNMYKCVYSSDNVSQYISNLSLFGQVDFIHAFRDHSKNMLERSKKIKIFNKSIEINVLLPEDIIALKLQAFTNDNLRELKEKTDIESIIENNKVDWNILSEYFTLFNKINYYNKLKDKFK